MVFIGPRGVSLCLLGFHWVFECDPGLHRGLSVVLKGGVGAF